MKKKQGFTLIELCIVVVIVGILAALSLVVSSGSMAQAAEKEAKINLEMLIAATDIYRMDNGDYYIATNATTINSGLKTNLPVTTARRWDYKIIKKDGTPPVACAIAQSTKTPTKCFRLCTDAPTFSLNCD